MMKTKPYQAPDWMEAGPGNFPWDEWQERALAAGVRTDVAQCGRGVYREAFNHSWNEDIKAECGWEDDGQAMLQLALSEPDTALRRWQELYQTDGGRQACYDEVTMSERGEPFRDTLVEVENDYWRYGVTHTCGHTWYVYSGPLTKEKFVTHAEFQACPRCRQNA